jgi:hypothetical protein
VASVAAELRGFSVTVVSCTTDVGELVADAILRNRFFVPTHPQVTDDLRRRIDNWDDYLDYQISREPPAPKGDNP